MALGAVLGLSPDRDQPPQYRLSGPLCPLGRPPLLPKPGLSQRWHLFSLPPHHAAADASLSQTPDGAAFENSRAAEPD
ncbi:hypothetical protein Q7V64_10220 [Streptococcus suis]|nr:hypothetical protein [Streptococcus suis]